MDDASDEEEEEGFDDPSDEEELGEMFDAHMGRMHHHARRQDLIDPVQRRNDSRVYHNVNDSALYNQDWTREEEEVRVLLGRF